MAAILAKLQKLINDGRKIGKIFMNFWAEVIGQEEQQRFNFFSKLLMGLILELLLDLLVHRVVKHRLLRDLALIRPTSSSIEVNPDSVCLTTLYKLWIIRVSEFIPLAWMLVPIAGWITLNLYLFSLRLAILFEQTCSLILGLIRKPLISPFNSCIETASIQNGLRTGQTLRPWPLNTFKLLFHLFIIVIYPRHIFILNDIHHLSLLPQCPHLSNRILQPKLLI